MTSMRLEPASITGSALDLIEQSLPNDEGCDEVGDEVLSHEGPATTPASIKNVQTPGPRVLTGRQNTDNDPMRTEPGASHLQTRLGGMIGLQTGARRAPEAPALRPTMETVRRFFERDQYAKLAGIELLTLEPGHATARMPLRPTHWNGLDMTHGGAIFTLADFVFAAASNSHGTVAVAINASISFLKASSTGTLTAEARELARNYRTGTYLVEVKNDQGELIAIFQGMVYRKQDKIPA